ncbi:MAG: AAA family ATPase [Actinomycetota bacterium]
MTINSVEPTFGLVDAVETHLSMLFLTPDRVYKQLKPVDAGFVSFVDRPARLAQTSREFELNRRISPEVYLALTDVVGHGRTVERLIVMRRLPEDRQLDRCIDRPDLPDRLRAVARFIAAFHARQQPIIGAAAAGATAARLRARWEENLDVLRPLAGTIIPADQYAEVWRLADRFIAGRDPLLTERISGGRVVDGHGDLRAEHVFVLDDGPQVIDCVAFRDDFRIGDVLNDVAFLVMDLHRLAGSAVAARFIRDYDEFSNEHHPSTLAHHYVAYRAHVRAKIAAIRFAQGDRGAAAEVGRYHDLALHHLRLGQVRLIVVGGGPGTGKSTVADGLARRIGAVWLRTDEIRKGLAGVGADDHLPADAGEGIYRDEFSGRVYDELLHQADSLLTRGESVVLDATWADAARRADLRLLAERTAATLTELRCVAPVDIAKARILQRSSATHNPSDATPDIADHIAARFDDWPEAITVDTTEPPPATVVAAQEAVVAPTISSSDPSDPLRPRRSGQRQVADPLAIDHEAIWFLLVQRR